jgi:hypothetical protein
MLQLIETWRWLKPQLQARRKTSRITLMVNLTVGIQNPFLVVDDKKRFDAWLTYVNKNRHFDGKIRFITPWQAAAT